MRTSRTSVIVNRDRHPAARRTACLTDHSAFLNCSIDISLETPYTSWNNYMNSGHVAAPDRVLPPR